jgi:hypothetical protein
MGKRPVANDDEVVNKGGDPGQLWWIDDEGGWHLVDTESPEAYLSCPIGQSREQQGFAFRDLGLMKVNTAESHLSVQWDVIRVAPAAVDSLFAYLDGSDREKPVTLNFFFQGWRRETQPSQQAAIDRIAKTMAYRGISLANIVMLHHHGLGEIGRSSRLIQRGYKAWEESAGLLTLDRNSPFDPLIQEIIVFMPDEFGELFRHLYVGPRSGYSQVFGKAWAAEAPGRTRGPDNKYIYETNKPYAGVLQCGEPRFDHIRALVSLKDADPVWTSYQRLITPCKLEDGTPIVTIISKLTEDVSVEFMAGVA